MGSCVGTEVKPLYISRQHVHHADHGRQVQKNGAVRLYPKEKETKLLNTSEGQTKPRPHSSGSYREYRHLQNGDDENSSSVGESENAQEELKVDVKEVKMSEVPATLNGGKPFVIWIMGGPGSSKVDKMDEICVLYPNWFIIPVGGLLWDHLAELHPNGVSDNPDPPSPARHIRKPPVGTLGSKANLIKGIMKKGEMVPQGIVLDLAVQAMHEIELENPGVEGFFVVGYPRDIVQVQSFEDKTGMNPPCILIDCSELELGRSLGQRRGRLDDNFEAYKRRLELYRELTLPMFKTLDEQKRLRIVDGDQDVGQVVKELRRSVHREIGALRRDRAVETIVEQSDDNDHPDSLTVQVASLPGEVDDPSTKDDSQDSDPSGEAESPDGEDEKPAAPAQLESPRKRLVRHYAGMNPEVEADLQKVIEELQETQQGQRQQNMVAAKE